MDTLCRVTIRATTESNRRSLFPIDYVETLSSWSRLVAAPRTLMQFHSHAKLEPIAYCLW